MEELLKQILTETDHKPKNINVPCFSYHDKTFYFWINIEESRLRQFKNKDDYREDPNYKTVLEAYSKEVNAGEQHALEKNASLIVLVKCADISALTSLQQQILLMEEDEYFFKKYVILYTFDSISQLTSEIIVSYLRSKVNDPDKFNSFSTAGYTSELAEYLVVLQLFIKLPFLKLEHGDEKFTSLDQKIKLSLNDTQSFYDSLIEQSSDLLQIDFTDPSHDDRINALVDLSNR